MQNEPNFLTSSQSVGCKKPLVVEVEFHRRERWRTRRTPSKAAKTEAMRIGGPVFRNEPNLLTEIEVPLQKHVPAIGHCEDLFVNFWSRSSSPSDTMC